MRNTDNLQFMRDRFLKANKFFSEAGIAPETSFLRVNQKLVNGNGKYSFDITKASNPTITEKKLERNDLFIVIALGLFLFVEDSAKPGTGILATYPAPVDATAGALAFPSNDIEALYNGYLQIKTGQTVNFESIPNQLFRTVPESQKLDDLLAEYRLSDSLYYPSEELTFCGTKTHTITTEFPSFPTAVYGDNSFLSFYCLGYLVKNGCTVKSVGNTPNPYLGEQ